jgi:hypothetical protein
VASQVDIANAALAKLGQTRISSLDDASTTARAVKARWDMLRDAELRSHPWKFALTRGVLAQITTAPEWGYAYQYRLPAGFIRLAEINDDWWWYSEDSAPWKIEGDVILADMAPPLRARWTERVTEAPRYDPLFCEVLASRLALELTYLVTASLTLKRDLRTDHQVALREAYRVDAIERSPVPLRDGSWILGRV